MDNQASIDIHKARILRPSHPNSKAHLKLVRSIPCGGDRRHLYCTITCFPVLACRSSSSELTVMIHQSELQESRSFLWTITLPEVSSSLVLKGPTPDDAPPELLINQHCHFTRTSSHSLSGILTSSLDSHLYGASFAHSTVEGQHTILRVLDIANRKEAVFRIDGFQGYPEHPASIGEACFCHSYTVGRFLRVVGTDLRISDIRLMDQ